MNDLSPLASALPSPSYISSSPGIQREPEKTPQEKLSLQDLVSKCLDDSCQDSDRLDLSNRIYASFLKNQGSEFKTIFDELIHDDNKFYNFAFVFVSCSSYSIAYMCEFLERLDWPANRDKPVDLRNLVMCMLMGGLRRDRTVKVCKNEVAVNKGESVPITEVLVDFRPLIGKGNYNHDPITLPSYIYKVLGTMLRYIDIQEDSYSDAAKKWQGVGMILGQFTECRFPASLLSPLLPHLAQMENLVALDVSDVGLVISPNGVDNKRGFTDTDAQAFYTLLEKNPCLIDFRVNYGGMSTGESKKFEETLASTLIKHYDHFWEGVKSLSEKQNKPPSIEQIYDSMVKGD